MISLSAINRVFTVGDEQVHALQDVNLTIKQGEYVAIMGPSGSGKSTLLNMIGLLDRPDNGIYLLENEDMTELSDHEQAALRRHKVGFIFQFFHLVPRMTAAENIELPMILAGVDPRERKKRVEKAVKDFGLGNRSRHRPDQLSGGQRQRVAIARATIMEPHILLADEPTGNLDRVSGQEVIEIIETLNDQNMTVIMVTHDPELGKRAARQILMVDGRIDSDRSQ
ncbi:ABC transporter ATP-binding protein [Desulfosediminicola flagellatus]|uniref:ABC transporter ATP-binding protein n=1 Tax=Desulfosediminicola flagellatus TaxID=2569541 RepID=UPI0010AD84E8|nr:ABC transporter ATP-binding protein [Desulfosediminicola flagellatus]